MTIMHLFTIAESRNHGFNRDSQFRAHANIPWDEAYELYLDPGQLAALIKLARAAQGDAYHGLRGRVFDVMRETLAMAPVPPYVGRDRGPYALVTPSSVWHRLELERYLQLLTIQEWQTAHDRGNLILSLARSIS